MTVRRLAAVLVTLVLSGEAHATGDLVGVFEFSGSSVEQSRIDAQVEGAIKDMGFYIRPIARHRLHKLTKPAVRFEFRPFEGGVRVVNEMVNRPCHYDGSRVSFTNRLGKQTEAVCARSDKGIKEDFIGADAGTWSHTFTLSSDGRMLEQRVRVTAPMLGQPLQYTLTYVRTGT